jgi:predicted  nucleic acid-binding Zn-ribbon protein
MTDLVGAINPFSAVTTEKVADKDAIRKFVKDMIEMTEKVKDAQGDLKEVIDSNEEIIDIDEEIKSLKERRKQIIAESAVIQGYLQVLNEVLEEKQQVISDAKQDNVPKSEIDLAIKALKKNIDMKLSTEVYSNIADLID